MAWTSPVDYSTGQIITAAIWNNMLGSGGNIDETAPAKVTTAGDLVYGTGANALSRLGIGSARQTLQTNAAANAPEWVASPQSLLDAKGEILGASAANTLGALAAGTNDYVLTADSSETLGIKWAAAGGGGAWTLEAADTTERGFTNSSDAQLFQITSLNIANTKPIKVIGHVMGTVNTASSSATPQFYIRGFNGTQIATYGGMVHVGTSGSSSHVYRYEIDFGPREQTGGSREWGRSSSNAVALIKNNGAYDAYVGGAAVMYPNYGNGNPSDSSVPTTSAITSIEFGAIGYSTDQFYCKNVFVYSLAVS